MEEAERMEDDTSPATLISPNTALVLFLHSMRLAVCVEVDDWMINPLVEELDVRTWRAETGVDVLMAILLIEEVAYISVPEMIHSVSAAEVEVTYLLPCPSRRFPETARYPVRVMLVPEALVNLNDVMVVDAERRSSAVRAPLMVEMVDEVDLNPLLVSSLAMVVLPLAEETLIVDVPERAPPTVAQNGKLKVVIADEVEMAPDPPLVEVEYLFPCESKRTEMVPEVERKSLAVRAPLMVEMVAEVERRLLAVKSLLAVTFQFRLEMVDEVDRKLLEIS